jgi:hypothetical protein
LTALFRGYSLRADQRSAASPARRRFVKQNGVHLLRYALTLAVALVLPASSIAQPRLDALRQELESDDWIAQPTTRRLSPSSCEFLRETGHEVAMLERFLWCAHSGFRVDPASLSSQLQTRRALVASLHRSIADYRSFRVRPMSLAFGFGARVLRIDAMRRGSDDAEGWDLVAGVEDVLGDVGIRSHSASDRFFDRLDDQTNLRAAGGAFARARAVHECLRAGAPRDRAGFTAVDFRGAAVRFAHLEGRDEAGRAMALVDVTLEQAHSEAPDVVREIAIASEMRRRGRYVFGAVRATDSSNTNGCYSYWQEWYSEATSRGLVLVRPIDPTERQPTHERLTQSTAHIPQLAVGQDVGRVVDGIPNTRPPSLSDIVINSMIWAMIPIPGAGVVPRSGVVPVPQ